MKWDLDDLGRALLGLLKTTFGELGRLFVTPWHLRAYCESVGMAQPLPATLVARMEAFTGSGHLESDNLEDTAVAVNEGFEILRGIHDAFKDVEADTGAAAFDAFQRLVWPAFLAGIRRDPDTAYWYPLVAAWPTIVDTHIAENFAPAFSIERIYAAAKALGGRALGNHEEATGVVWAQGLLALAALVFAKVYNARHDRDVDERWVTPRFSFGWESHLAEPRVGEDPTPAVPPAIDDTRDALPIWMAQRTFSLRMERDPPPFKLATYDTAPHSHPPHAEAFTQGITVVPVPPGVSAEGAAGLYLQYGVELTPVAIPFGDGWRFRIRTRGQAGAMIPIPKRLDEGSVGAGVGAEIELAWAPTIPPSTTTPTPPPPPPPPPGTPTPVPTIPDVAPSGGVQLEVGGFKLIGFIGGGGNVRDDDDDDDNPSEDEGGEGHFGLDDAGFAAQASQAVLTLTPKSEVLGSLVRTNLRITLDAGLVVSLRRGVVFEGGSTLDLYFAVRRSLGSNWLGASLSFIRLRAAYQQLQHGGKLLFEATVGLTLSALKITLAVEGIGGVLSLESGVPDGNLLGMANLTGDMVMPNAIGLKVEWGPVHGGGTFGYDKPNDRYWGTVEIALGGTWTLRGVGFTEPRPGGGNSTYVSVTFEREAAPTAFDVTGFGGMIALHRRADDKKMFESMKTGALDALLFPEDPIANSGAIVASLASMFPPETDVHVLGLMIRFSFLKGLGTAKLGFLVQFGTGEVNRTKIIVALVGKFALRGSLARVLSIEVDGLGVYDAVTEELEIHAELRNSRLCGGDLVGGLTMFNGDPDPNDDDRTRGTFFSIGGYHPSYYGGKGPQRAAVQNRLALTIKRGNAITLEVSFYLALTPSAFHLGARGRLDVLTAGFGLSGELWFDGLVTYDWDFDITVGGSVKLTLFSRTVCSLRLEGRATGASPTHLSGKVSFEVLWWTVSKSFGQPLSDEIEAADAAPDLSAQIRAALADPGSYRTPSSKSVVFSTVGRAGIWATPEGSLLMTQKIAPLDTRIDRAGTARLPSPRTIQLDHAFAGTDTSAHRVANGEFAPGLYFTLDTPSALSAPATETLPAGFEVATTSVAGSGDVPAIALFDEIVIDRGQTKKQPKRGVFAGALATAFEAGGGIAPTTSPVTIAPPRYAAGTFAATRERDPRRLRRMEGR